MTFGDPKVMVLWALEKSFKTLARFHLHQTSTASSTNKVENRHIHSFFLALELVKVALPMVCIIF